MTILSLRPPSFMRLPISITGLRQMGITAHVLILPGAAIDHNPLLCVVPPLARSAMAAGRVQRHGRANKSLHCLLDNLLALVDADATPGAAIEAGAAAAWWELTDDTLGYRP